MEVLFFGHDRSWNSVHYILYILYTEISCGTSLLGCTLLRVPKIDLVDDYTNRADGIPTIVVGGTKKGQHRAFYYLIGGVCT